MSILRRRRGERGAAALEFALVVPLLLTFMLGTVELALFMKDYVSMSSSVRAGARTASAAPDAGPGTCDSSGPTTSPCSPADAPGFAQAAADTMQRAGTAMNADDIEWVMIYAAGPNGYPIDQSTLNCSSKCVKYVWDAPLKKFRFDSGSWDSASVNACVNDPKGDSVGVGLQAKHNWMTGLVGGLMGGDKIMQERTVMRFEPLEQERCGPDSPSPHN